MNSRGQTLVVFVIFIPVLILLGALIIDVGRYAYEVNHLNSINRLSIEYGLKYIDDEPEKKLVLIMLKNDPIISDYKVNINSDKKIISLYIEKDMSLLFTRVIGKESYKVKSRYRGYIDSEDKFVIRRDDNNE